MNTSLVGVGLFEMTLDDGRLPVQVDVNRNLHSHLDARDFSTAAMTGYYKALWIRDAAIIATGNFSALSAEVDSINNIKYSISNPKGIYNDHWPQSASTEFDASNPTPAWTAAE
ncbi:hypothetical protein ACQPXH_02975 [Nocardia sp. CA-135953]|uniref:hypothetical protein n=1 Tax=Nocardia sp. CA-135953 TaxID=3239978 RepID=UPI003D98012A